LRDDNLHLYRPESNPGNVVDSDFGKEGAMDLIMLAVLFLLGLLTLGLMFAFVLACEKV
jgi:hypothetical protein